MSDAVSHGAANAVRIDGIYIGELSHLEPGGHATGIFKRPVETAIQLTALGLEGDVQADRRVHGGPEKALHHYAVESYALLAEQFPQLSGELRAGSMGENVSTSGWREDDICIGDVFRIGSCRVQVSQPRSPCWKINHKFGEAGLSRAVAERGLTGWYYRVLEQGWIERGDAFELIERNGRALSLGRLWRTSLEHRPAAAQLREMMATPGLATGWVRKLSERLEWLERNPGPSP